MGEKKVELIEVNILADDDLVNEKATINANGTGHAQNGTKPSISDNQSDHNDQPSEDIQPIDDNCCDQQNCNSSSIFNQIKNLCLLRTNKTVKRQERIQKILVSINSVEADLNRLPENPSFCKWKCNKEMAENIVVGIAILTVVAAFLIPVILYYTGPPIPKIDDGATDFFKTCQFPVRYFNYINTS